MRCAALIFDFDGVLIESEAEGNRHVAQFLTNIGHPTTEAESFARFTGLSGAHFIDAIEDWIGAPLPPAFFAARTAEDARAMREGIGAVDGAVPFVESLAPALPRAIASSSSTAWIGRHLEHIGLAGAFAGRIFSGKEHVSRGKPAPDIYLHAAAALGADIADCAIIEDSLVGATGALASGAFVIGFTGGSHCGPDHADRLRALGVPAIAGNFKDISALLD